VDWLQHNIQNTKLVEGSSQAEGLDENLILTYILTTKLTNQLTNQLTSNLVTPLDSCLPVVLMCTWIDTKWFYLIQSNKVDDECEYSIYMRLVHFRETRLEDLHILGLEGINVPRCQGRWHLTRPSIASCAQNKPWSTLPDIEYSSGQVFYQSW